MKQILLATALLSLTACQQAPQEVPMTSAQKKTISFTMDYPDLIEKVPEGEVATALADGFGLIRMYVNGKDVGPISVNGTVEVDVPADAKTFELRSVSLPHSKRASSMLDISKYGANSKIKVTSSMSLLNPDLVDLQVQTEGQ